MSAVRPQTRVVKPRTAKQRAAIAKAKQFRITIPAATAGPSSSWWVGTSRAEFAARVAEHHDRMALSKFGRLNTQQSLE